MGMTAEKLAEQVPERINVAEAARILGVGPATVRRYLRTGKLKGIKYGPTRGDDWFVDVASVRKLALKGGQ